MCNFLLALITTLLAAIGIINGVPPNLPFPSPPPSPSPSPPPPFDQRVLRVYDGINSVSNVRKQPALTGEVRVSGTQSERYLSVLTSSLEVAQYMGIEAEVTASYSGLGTGSGSASLKVRAVPSTQPRTAHMTDSARLFVPLCQQISRLRHPLTGESLLGSQAHRKFRGHSSLGFPVL